jgi:hypothetical protein
MVLLEVFVDMLHNVAGVWWLSTIVACIEHELEILLCQKSNKVNRNRFETPFPDTRICAPKKLRIDAGSSPWRERRRWHAWCSYSRPTLG